MSGEFIDVFTSSFAETSLFFEQRDQGAVRANSS